MPAAAACYNRHFVKDPLIGPLAAIASGILAARFVPFHSSELLAAIAAFLALGILAQYRGSRVLAGACCSLGLFCGGALTYLAHRPGPPPELDATGREIVILSGCVIEPPAISGERERFLLELDPGARAQVTLYTRDGESLPALRYGQNVELDARVRKPRNFEQSRGLRLRRISRRASRPTGPLPQRPAMSAFSPAAAARLSRKP